MSDLPPRTRTRPDLCAGLDHPGVTYNDWLDQTWCLCGEHVYDGKTSTADEHLACCNGPLVEEIAP